MKDLLRRSMLNVEDKTIIVKQNIESSVINKQLAIFFILLLFFSATAALASPDTCPENHIPFGMSTALSGPAARLGVNMRIGVELAFAEANAKGGIQGRKLCLKALDDGYEPERTVPNIKHLIEQDKVLALIGNVGTPTAVVAAPICQRLKTLYFGAYTGAGILRKNPPERYVINYRASYAEETEAMVNGLINFGGLQPHEIAFFTQRDAFGDAGFAGGLQALKRHGLSEERLIIHARYERNTTAVENGLATILLANPTPKAIIMVGSYGPCAEFVRLARTYGVQSRILAVSFVGAALLAEELGEVGEGVVITEVVPHYRANVPIVQEFRLGLQVFNPEQPASFGALEGYIVARILIKALRTIKGEVGREEIVDALAGLGQFDLGCGGALSLSKKEHQASHHIWPSVIRSGAVVPFAWQELGQP